MPCRNINDHIYLIFPHDPLAACPISRPSKKRVSVGSVCFEIVHKNKRYCQPLKTKINSIPTNHRQGVGFALVHVKWELKEGSVWHYQELEWLNLSRGGGGPGTINVYFSKTRISIGKDGKNWKILNQMSNAFNMFMIVFPGCTQHGKEGRAGSVCLVSCFKYQQKWRHPTALRQPLRREDGITHFGVADLQCSQSNVLCNVLLCISIRYFTNWTYAWKQSPS